MHAKWNEVSCIHFGAGAAVQLDLFCAASHSMEPGAQVGWVDWAALPRASRSASSCSAPQRLSKGRHIIQPRWPSAALLGVIHRPALPMALVYPQKGLLRG